MHVLLLTMCTPLLGAAIIALLPDRRRRLIKAVALAHTAATLIVSWALLLRFDRTTPDLQFVELFPLAGDAGGVSLGVDGLSFPLVLLTTLLSLVALLASLDVKHRVKGYFFCLLFLEFAVIGLFESQSWTLFYMFWELTLVPLFLLISIWGGDERSTASMSFLLYTLGGSIFMLVALIAVYVYSSVHTFDMATMARAHGALPRDLQRIAFLGFFIGFAVKIPVFPLHAWLPLAHVEAPTPASIMLSAVLLKMGAYGLMRVTSLLPQGVEAFAPLLFGAALVNIVYGALLAWRQTDLKAMVAYSSISHMGFVLLGIASLNTTGFIGATMQMLTHGVITGALFLLVGALYERTHTRDITEYGGLSRVAPVFTAVTSLTILASMGLPGLAGFVSELFSMVGGFERWRFAVGIASVGMLITASYSMRAINRIFLGPTNPRWADLGDMSYRDIATMAPLGALMIGIGFVPSVALDLITATIRRMVGPF